MIAIKYPYCISSLGIFVEIWHVRHGRHMTGVSEIQMWGISHILPWYDMISLNSTALLQYTRRGECVYRHKRDCVSVFVRVCAKMGFLQLSSVAWMSQECLHTAWHVIHSTQLMQRKRAVIRHQAREARDNKVLILEVSIICFFLPKDPPPPPIPHQIMHTVQCNHPRTPVSKTTAIDDTRSNRLENSSRLACSLARSFTRFPFIFSQD